MLLSETARGALLRLLDDHRRLNGRDRHNLPPFPGACGRGGTALCKLGLARRLGRTVFSSNRRGELPDAYVAFELTPAGLSFAEKLANELHK